MPEPSCRFAQLPCRIARWALPASLAIFVLLLFLTLSGYSAATDLAVLQGLRALSAPWLTKLLILVTYLGSWPVILVIGLLFAYSEQRHGLEQIYVLLVASIGGGLLSGLLKNLIQRPRPSLLLPLAQASGFSFPSGHALLALVFYGTLAHIYVSRLSSVAKVAMIYTAAILLILAIGFSRLYLGVHYLTDVLAGFAIGAAWVSLVAMMSQAGWLRFNFLKRGKQS